jgi:disease resistance protein RPM1
MQRLNDEDSKKLFLSRVFGSMDDVSCPEELKNTVMKNILKKCGGLPMAIVSIASILAGYTSAESRDKWETICKSIGYQMESNPTLEGMRHILTLSYNHLPHELKGCMMYLSIFPEDYEIRKDRLLNRWIAEGLVQEKRGLTLMDVAESYLEELVSRNMVEPLFGFDGKMKSCKVHDMLLEVMVSKSLEANFVSLLGGQYAAMSYNRIRRLSIQGGDDNMSQSQQDGARGMDLEHVRSLSMFHLHEHKLLDNLDKFTLLRVLDLEDCQGLRDNHMRYVCRLYLLKFLSVRLTKIREMPAEVGKLEYLQTLDAGCTCLNELPETITNLGKLENVAFSKKGVWESMWKLPRGINKMKALRVFDTAYLPNDARVGRELGELQQLQTIGMYIASPGDQVIPALVESLGKLPSLRRLRVASRDINHGDITFLHEITRPPQLLRYLTIEGMVLRGGLPTWVGSLRYLVEIVIMRIGLTDDQLFGVLCRLPHLKSIIMLQMSYRSDELVARTHHNFPVLSSLILRSDWNVEPKVIRFEEGSMAKLEKLDVRFGKQIRSIHGIEQLPNLKQVELSGERNNASLSHALDQLKVENSRRSDSNHDLFQVVVKYD